MNSPLKQYALITGNYWAFYPDRWRPADAGSFALSPVGFSPLAIAMLFLFYEFFGVVTNLVGGWLGARLALIAP